MPKYKIGFVLDTSLDPADGVQQYVIAVGEWLREHGQDVHYLVGETSERDLPNVHSLSRNISVVFNGNRTTIPLPTSRRKLRSFIHHEKFDILHVQTPHNPFLAQRLVLAAGSGTIVVGTFHILPYTTMARIANKALGYWLRPSLRRFDKMLAVSPAAAVFEKWSFGLEAEVLPNVVDYNRFHDAKPFERYQDNILTILFVGRLVPRKGCMILLQAVELLRRKNGIPAFRVVVCGKGPLDSELRTYASGHDLDDVVEFTGFVTEEDKPRYYTSADISVFPSSAGESFGIVLLEAMASGNAAVLAGDNPGYASVMEPQPELLFKPTDAEVLAAKLQALMSDTALRTRLAGWGEAYTKDFDVDVVGRKLLNLYENLYTSKNVQ
jgi:phosphatidylinositol alpha-mannosyltransferase